MFDDVLISQFMGVGSWISLSGIYE